MDTTTDWITAVGTGLAAFGTLLAFLVAFVQIKTERDARKRLDEETEQRERRAQAERISAWPSDDEAATITLLNRSSEPVYRAIASLVMVQGAGAPPRQLKGHLAGFQIALTLIPPGEHRTSMAGGWGGMSRRPGVELAFTDRAGVHWVRHADGSLVEINQAPVEHYDVALPTSRGRTPIAWRAAADQASDRRDAEAFQAGTKLPAPSLPAHDAQLEQRCREAEALAGLVAQAMAELDAVQARVGADVALEMTSAIDAMNDEAAAARAHADRLAADAERLAALARWAAGEPAWARPNEIASGNPMFTGVNEGIAETPVEPRGGAVRGGVPA